MKKYILIIICTCGIVLNIHAQYPIPSYNIPVFPRANFTEESITPAMFKKMAPMEKVRFGIQATQSQPDSIPNITTVYVYRLDKSIILGPFYITGSNTLYVDIDSQQWGVLVSSLYPEDVSVWTEEFTSIFKLNDKLKEPYKIIDQNMAENSLNPSYYRFKEFIDQNLLI